MCPTFQSAEMCDTTIDIQYKEEVKELRRERVLLYSIVIKAWFAAMNLLIFELNSSVFGEVIMEHFKLDSMNNVIYT